MDNIVDLNAERNARSRPDASHVMRDDYGREMFKFILSYDFDGGSWGGVYVWAYSAEDAENRVAAMRASLRCDGQLYSEIPL